MGQIANKYIADNAVNGRTIRLNNNEIFRATKADGSDASLYRYSAANELLFLSQPKADVGLSLPSALKDYVTVEWVQNYFNGKQDPKETVYAYADSNVPLTGSTPLVVDGLTLNNGDDVGLGGNTDAKQNGPYKVAISGGNYTLTRRSDFNENSEVSKGAYFPVLGGGVYAGYTVILTTDTPDIGTSNLQFVAYPSAISIIAGDMVSKVGNTLSIDLADLSGLESTAPGTVGGRLRVKTDPASLDIDKTTRLDPTTGAVMTPRKEVYARILTADDITNQRVALPYTAIRKSVQFCPDGAGKQSQGVDYDVNYTGGSGGKSIVTFLGGLATGGVSALVVNERVEVSFETWDAPV